MIDWLWEWWPVVIIYQLRHVLLAWAGFGYQWVGRRLDDLVPDSRRRTTEEWVDGKLDELGMIAEVDLGRWGPVALRERNAFLPLQSAIGLADETATKKDATFWIVGAHELGHAIWHRRFPRVSRWALGARGAAAVPFNLAMTLLLTNTLLGWSLVSDLMLFLVVSFLALQLVVLVDEALASLTAFRLVTEEAFTPLEERAMRIKLAAAFTTYLSTIVPAVLMLVFWRPLTGMLEAVQLSPRPTDANHEWWVGVMVVVQLVSIGAFALLWIRGKLRMSEQEEEDDDTEKKELNCRAIVIVGVALLFYLAASTAFFHLTYDGPYGEVFRAVLLLAAPTAWLLPGIALGLLTLPLTLPINWLKKATGLIAEPDPEAYLPDTEELRERLDSIDVKELQERAKRLERGEPEHKPRKKRDPDKKWERWGDHERKRKRGRLELEQLPQQGTLAFWLFQLNPIWVLPALVLWLMWP